MLRRSCPSCVDAVAVTNKIVRNLPFSSSLSFIANNKKSIVDDFIFAHVPPQADGLLSRRRKKASKRGKETIKRTQRKFIYYAEREFLQRS